MSLHDVMRPLCGKSGIVGRSVVGTPVGGGAGGRAAVGLGCGDTGVRCQDESFPGGDVLQVGLTSGD